MLSTCSRRRTAQWCRPFPFSWGGLTASLASAAMATAWSSSTRFATSCTCSRACRRTASASRTPSPPLEATSCNKPRRCAQHLDAQHSAPRVRRHAPGPPRALAPPPRPTRARLVPTRSRQPQHQSQHQPQRQPRAGPLPQLRRQLDPLMVLAHRACRTRAVRQQWLQLMPRRLPRRI